MQLFLDLAHRLADESGILLRNRYRLPVPVEMKSDNSPVTIADKEVEARLRKVIWETFPQHGVLGEEEGDDRQDAEYVWVIDPIDGTRSFLAGKPNFTTLIALCHNSVPILGVIDQPILGERWVGAQGLPSSTLNNRSVTTRPCTKAKDALLATTSPELFDDRYFLGFGCARSAVRDVIYGGDAYNYALLASGYIDLVIEQGLKPYDYLALVPVIEGAGGVITDWEGKPLTLLPKGKWSDGTILASANGDLHDETLALLRMPYGE